MTKIDQKTLTERKNNTPSPHVFSIGLFKKNRTRTAALPPPSSLSSFFFSNVPTFLVLTCSIPPLSLLKHDYK
jgi:hypothetical protein